MSEVYVRNISPGNDALEFIDKRLQDDKYRGSRSSQHNRYTMDELITILKLLDKYAPRQSLMHIRTTEFKKRKANLPTEAIYSGFCNEVKSTIGKGTQDAMRKNLFPDFHRMDLIVRYNRHRMPTDPHRSQPITYVSLSDQGSRLVQAESIDEQFYIFSRGVDRLLGGFINVLLRLLRDSEYSLKRIEIHEFMFFVSAIGTPTSFNIKDEQCVGLIRSYRNLARTQRHAVVDTLAQKLKPENFDGDKPSQRHYRNWLNKAEQIYHILNQTVYFEVRDKILYLRCGKVRSFSEKVQYFKRHRVQRTLGFEFHHVVPLGWSESEDQFKLFDNWQNMVYISAFEHATITQQGNRNVVMTTDHENIILSDYSENQVFLKNRETILYDARKQPIMVQYNQRLLQAVE